MGGRGSRIARLAAALATLAWLLAWARLGAVGVAQPSRWRDSPALAAYTCRLNAFQRDNLVYRYCDRDRDRSFLIAIDPGRQALVGEWALPATFPPALGFEAVAADPAGGLTILAQDRAGIARLHPDGTVEALPAPQGGGIVYGFGWQAGQLGLVAAPADPPGSPMQLAVYRDDGWSPFAPLPGPDCPEALVCTPLVATVAPGGWATYYARAPRHPAEPDRVEADILRVAPGDTRRMQTIALTAASRAYGTEDGQLRWATRFADRTGGNVLNYGGRPSLRQLADGTFAPLPTPPDDLLPTSERDVHAPEPESLTDAYRIDAARLTWLPTFTRGFGLGTERAILREDRWVALGEGQHVLTLTERPLDPTATLPPGAAGVTGPPVVGRQAARLDFDAYSAPLLVAPGGGYWLIGRQNEIARIGTDLRRTDGHGPLARLRLLFADFDGPYRDDFHSDLAWLKRAALAWVLAAWPLLALGVALRARLAPGDPAARPARHRNAALAYLALALLATPWFWTATALF